MEPIITNARGGVIRDSRRTRAWLFDTLADGWAEDGQGMVGRTDGMRGGPSAAAAAAGGTSQKVPPCWPGLARGPAGDRRRKECKKKTKLGDFHAFDARVRCFLCAQMGFALAGVGSFVFFYFALDDFPWFCAQVGCPSGGGGSWP